MSRANCEEECVRFAFFRASVPDLSRLPRIAFFLVALFMLLQFVGPVVMAQENSAPSNCPPKARVDDIKEDIHGTIVADPYRWLENQTSPETRAWIDAEDRCTQAALGKIPQRAAIQRRLNELMKVEAVNAPLERNGRLFFSRRGPDQDLFVLYMRQGLTGEDHLLVDPAGLSPDHSTSVTLENVSDDGKLLFYGIRKGGEDEVTIHVLDVDKREDLKDVLPRASYFTISPTPDDRGFYYARVTDAGPRAMYHALGTDPAKDPVVFGEGFGHDKILVTELSQDGSRIVYTVLYGSGIEQTAVYAQDLRAHGPVLPIVNDLVSIFFPRIVGDTLYMQTNWNAPMGRIVAVDMTNPARAAWREVVPETTSHLESFEPAGGRIAALYSEKAVSKLKIFNADGSSPTDIQLPALGALTGLNGRWASDMLFFSFVSFNYPPTVFAASAAHPGLTVWAKPRVPLRSDDFAVEQVFYDSKDGTHVPMFLFYKKGLRLDGNNPALMTAYGGFSVSYTPVFNVYGVLWAEEGGIYAVPNLRGGGEFGEAWHRAGMLQNKQNVFDDFIAAGEWLVANKYTSPARLSIMGISNGGLLMGAALTQRPDLFRAVVCMYPLLDMIRYQKFLDGPYWVPEYGSSDRPDQFKWLYAYSPYHHVRQRRDYPAVLFITGDGDTRVAPLHARKMTAELQAATASDKPILLLYDTKSGHSGGRPLGKEIEEHADILSFLFWQLGVNAN